MGGDPYMKGRKPRTHKRQQKKQQRAAIPVSTPKIPMGFEASGGGGMNAAALMYQKLKNEINSNLEKGNLKSNIIFILTLIESNKKEGN